METDYGTVRFISETSDHIMVYIYEIQDYVVRSALFEGRPYISLIRYTKEGRPFFLKENHRIYLDELEELNVI